MTNTIIEILGWVATVTVLTAFFLNTRNKIKSDSYTFLLLNFVSGFFMAINSGYHQAYPSMIANSVWMSIVLPGLFKKTFNFD
jgi:hypothetical protein